MFLAYLTTAIWGFGFVATSWAIAEIGPFTTTTLRFAISTLIFLVFLRLKGIKHDRGQFKLAFWPGIFLALSLVFQTWGLKYTSITNNGFLTTLYIIMIPIIERVVFKKKITWTQWFCIVLGFVGSIVICNVHDLTNINIGDALTVVCALMAAFQIIQIGRVADKITSSLLYNFYQGIWILIAALTINLIMDPHMKLPTQPSAVGGIFYLAILSNLVGFTVQVVIQKKISATVAGLIFLLESPFAALAAYLFMGDPFTGREVLGGFMILIAAIGITLKSES
jgi:drug/metabolite transporter (DMT)-like permease